LKQRAPREKCAQTGTAPALRQDLSPFLRHLAVFFGFASSLHYKVYAIHLLFQHRVQRAAVNFSSPFQAFAHCRLKTGSSAMNRAPRLIFTVVTLCCLLSSCVHYRARPLTPGQSESSYRQRDFNDAGLAAFRASLEPLRSMLGYQPFIGGASPLFADYIVFGALQWARIATPYQLLEDSDVVAQWFARCLDLHGGLGRKVAAAA